MRTRTLRSVVYLASAVGVLLSLFAGAEILDTALTQICSFGGFLSCAAVANSGRTTLFLVPDWAWGLGGFVAIIVANALAEKHPWDRRYAYGLLGLTSLGVAIALYLLYVELAEIGALCLVCASAYAMGFIAWGGSIALWKTDPDPEPANPST